jgi:hypothetical protein
MEQILAFVLGVSAGVLIWAVVVAFRTTKKVNTLSEKLDGIAHQIDRNDELVNRRIDGHIDFTTNLHKDSLAYTDSRVDKLETKFIGTNGTKEIQQPIKKTNKKNKITN